MDAEDFQEVVRRTSDRVFSHAVYLLRSNEDAEDATQEVFVRLWKHRHRIERGREAAWIMRTAHNLCLDLLRKRSARAKRLRSWSHDDPGAAPGDGRPNPQQQYELARRQETLLRAMTRLPEKIQSMLLLHYFHGMTYVSIAEMLGMHTGTVRVAVHRGKRMLRGYLAEESEERRYEDGMRCMQVPLG